MEYPPDTPLKRCTECSNDLPATLEYFHACKSSKDGLRNLCKPCRSKRDKQYRLNNHEAILAKEKQYRQENHEALTAYQQKYREAHRESIRETSQRFRQRHGKQYENERQRRYRQNPVWRRRYNQYHRAYYRSDHEQQLTRARRYYAMHANHYHLLNRKWNKAHPERRSMHNRVQKARYRARLLSASGTHTIRDVRRQYAKQQGQCYYCHKQVERYHVDHVIPLSRGGSNGPENIVIACSTCNQRKGPKLLHEWSDGGRLL